MAIFVRLDDLLKANINEMLDKSENPEKMVKQIIIELETQMNSATRALDEATGSEKQTLKQLEDAKKSSQGWNDKEKLALNSGNKELANEALAQKSIIDGNIAKLQAVYDLLIMQTAQLRDQVSKLKSKQEEARIKQNKLIASSKMADAQKGIRK